MPVQSMLIQIHTRLNHIMNFAIQPRGDWTLNDAIIKGVEELGELAETVLITCGRLTHKTLPEHPSGEIADNINQLIDVLSFNEEKYPLDIHLQSLEAYKLIESIEEIGCPENTDPIINATIETFLAYKRTKNTFDEEPCHILFNALIENLVILNCLLMAVHEKITIDNINDRFFLKTNTYLSSHLQKKFNKWKKIEKMNNQYDNPVIK